LELKLTKANTRNCFVCDLEGNEEVF